MTVHPAEADGGKIDGFDEKLPKFADSPVSYVELSRFDTNTVVAFDRHKA